MSDLTRQAVMQALTDIIDTDLQRDIVSLKFVKTIEIKGSKVLCRIEPTTNEPSTLARIRQQASDKIQAISGVTEVDVQVISQTRPTGVAHASFPGIANIIPVASGKGGVGKSTVSVNLALALAENGARVGLMDADVYGPSVPLLMGIEDSPTEAEDGRITPVEKYGIKVISMGFFLPRDQALVWRGPMLQKTITQFLSGVVWGELDYLIVDLPPGTGDVQLTLCQQVPLTGAIVVSTPQIAAVNIAQKAIYMFRQLNTPILGIIENMSHHICAKCGERDDIFGDGGAKTISETMAIPFLGAIPIATSIRAQSDGGDPIVHAYPDSPQTRAFLELATNLATQVQSLAKGEATHQGVVDPQHTPRDISKDGEQIKIIWADGHISIYPPRYLRINCQCAQCVEEMTGRQLLDPKTIPLEIKAHDIQGVGNYGIRIWWDDGHSTGIYTYKNLRTICPSRLGEQGDLQTFDV